MDSLRHVGDLGNVEAGESGAVEIRQVDSFASLSGPRSIVGRALVITANFDDLGRGGTADSVTSGSSGSAVACGIISYIM